MFTLFSQVEKLETSTAEILQTLRNIADIIDSVDILTHDEIYKELYVDELKAALYEREDILQRIYDILI